MGSLFGRNYKLNQLAIVDFLQASLSISRDQTCPILFEGKQQIDQHFNEGYLVSQFSS